MRLTFYFAALVCAGSMVSAQEAEKPAPVKHAISEAWLGVGVAKPDETTATHVPELPPGIGFVVIFLAKDGPAETAGIEKFDLLWKMNEQMLVNEGQLATLLRLANPDDEVTISLFRKGKPIDLKVKLGENQGGSEEMIRKMLNDSVIRRGDGALRMVNVEKKTATITNAKGSAEVSRVEDGDAVRILDPNGKTIFEATLRGEPALSAVPKDWRRQVCAMRRGLDSALSTKAAPQRQPRPRIVPPNTAKPE